MFSVNVGEKEDQLIRPQLQTQMYSSGPTRADRMSASWTNKGKEIMGAELGPDEYTKRADKQKKAFEVS